MSLMVNEKVNSVDNPPPINLDIKVSGHFSNSAKKINSFVHPMIKVLGLILLQGVTCALDAYCLVSPIIVVEMTRLIFLCALALIVQNHQNTKSFYTNSIVSSFVQA